MNPEVARSCAPARGRGQPAWSQLPRAARWRFEIIPDESLAGKTAARKGCVARRAPGGSRRPTWGRQQVMFPNRRGWGPETAPTPPGSPDRLPRRVSSKGNGPHDLTATAGVPPTPSPQGGSGKTWCHRDRAVAPEPEVLRNGGRNQRRRPDRAARGPFGTPELLSNFSDKGMSYVWLTPRFGGQWLVLLVLPIRLQTKTSSKTPCGGRNRRSTSGSAGRNGEETARRHRPRG